MAYGGSTSAEIEIERLVQQHPSCKGLAVVIGSQDKPDKRDKLNGVLKDVDKMVRTFGQLKFAVLKCINYSQNCLFGVLRAVAAYKRYPSSWRRISFTFAGHGTANQIYTHDSAIDIYSIIDLFQPNRAPNLATIPKLFFFDVCRGESNMIPVVTARGGKNATKIAPSYGNCLVAFSTTMSFKAFEDSEGGVWLGILSEVLLTVDKSIFDVLVEVNKRLMEKYQDRAHHGYIQQPTVEGLVNEHVYLLQESLEGEITGPAVGMPQVSNGSLPLQLPLKQPAVAPMSYGGFQPSPAPRVQYSYSNSTSTPMELQVTHQQCSVAAVATTSQARGCPSYEEQLKEHLLNSSRPQDADNVFYTNKEQAGRHQATVYVPQLGAEKSDFCQTQKKARNDAARKALSKLIEE